VTQGSLDQDSREQTSREQGAQEQGAQAEGAPAEGALERGTLDVIAFGTVFLELVFGHVPGLPGPGEEVFTDEFAVSCGGCVIMATAARRAGLRAGLCTLLGEDLGSTVVTEHCRRVGVDLSTSTRVHGDAAGITTVMNFANERAFVSYLPPQASQPRRDAERWLDVLRERRPAWCYLHAGPGVSPLLRQARLLGIRIALDVGLNGIAEDRQAVVDCVSLADVFLPNEAELLALTRTHALPDAIGAATAWGTPLVVKRGADGAIVATRDGRTTVTAGLRAVHVRDRTGAGDAFAGALIGALHHGATLVEAAAAGNTAGSQTVSVLGGVGEVPVAGLSK
jgi:sugar/nucleoside kinase (ribokinase family)